MEKGLNFTDYKTGHRQVQRFVCVLLKPPKLIIQGAVVASLQVLAKPLARLLPPASHGAEGYSQLLIALPKPKQYGRG